MRLKRQNFYAKFFYAGRVSFAIDAAASHVNHFVALRAQFPQHLHPLHVGAVTVGMRQHLVYHQNIQRCVRLSDGTV
ncbi:MAG: hypothetical protein WA197_04080 [Candidatus Acidiferrales bacterium]